MAGLWLVAGCQAASTDPELRKEVQALKVEVAILKNKLTQMENGQKAILDLLKEAQAAKAAAPASPTAPAAPPAPVTATPPALPAPLTVPELFKNKNQLLGTRVTVRGIPGPVLMHKKTFFLAGPGGMLEVIYGNLQDQKLVERLTSQTIDTPLTVSGLLSAAPGQGKEASRLVIMADAVEF